MGINFGILTNGIKWLLFKTFENNPIERIIWEIDIVNDNIDTVEISLNSFSYSNIDVLESLIKKSKALENAWKNLALSIDSITEIISQKLSDKIKSLEPGLKIDISDVNKFTKSKIFEIFDIIENQIDDNSQKEIIDAESEYSDIKDSILGRHQKNKIREKVSVVFPDNTFIKYNKVVETFIETIKKIGPEKIQPLKIYRAGVPIVSDTKDDFYNQQQIGRFWIMVNTSTRQKVAILKEINNKLKLNLTIDTFINT